MRMYHLKSTLELAATRTNVTAELIEGILKHTLGEEADSTERRQLMATLEDMRDVKFTLDSIVRKLTLNTPEASAKFWTFNEDGEPQTVTEAEWKAATPEKATEMIPQPQLTTEE